MQDFGFRVAAPPKHPCTSSSGHSWVMAYNSRFGSGIKIHSYIYACIDWIANLHLNTSATQDWIFIRFQILDRLCGDHAQDIFSLTTSCMCTPYSSQDSPAPVQLWRMLDYFSFPPSAHWPAFRFRQCG